MVLQRAVELAPVLDIYLELRQRTRVDGSGFKDLLAVVGIFVGGDIFARIFTFGGVYYLGC
jgi:hypothetical protein